jgi:hypothetical protein
MNKSLKNTKKFEDLLREENNKYLELIYKDKKQIKILGRRIINHLLDEEKPEDYLPMSHTERERFLSSIFRDYYEIFQSMENLKMISISLSQFTNKKIYKINKITKVRYLRYHFENYLSETYIFEKRIEKFLNNISKKLKLKNLSKENQKITSLKIFLKKSLKNIDKIRGNHVHDKRFSDKDLSRLESLELYTSTNTTNTISYLFVPYRDSEYRQLRSKWAKTIDETNKNLQMVIDDILEQVKPIVFNKLITFYND